MRGPSAHIPQVGSKAEGGLSSERTTSWVRKDHEARVGSEAKGSTSSAGAGGACEKRAWSEEGYLGRPQRQGVTVQQQVACEGVEAAVGQLALHLQPGQCPGPPACGAAVNPAWPTLPAQEEGNRPWEADPVVQ